MEDRKLRDWRKKLVEARKHFGNYHIREGTKLLQNEEWGCCAHVGGPWASRFQNEMCFESFETQCRLCGRYFCSRHIDDAGLCYYCEHIARRSAQQMAEDEGFELPDDWDSVFGK